MLSREGVRPGDVILEVNRQPVRNAGDAVELSKNLKGRVLIRVWSNGGSHYIVVDDSKRGSSPLQHGWKQANTRPTIRIPPELLKEIGSSVDSGR